MEIRSYTLKLNLKRDKYIQLNLEIKEALNEGCFVCYLFEWSYSERYQVIHSAILKAKYIDEAVSKFILDLEGHLSISLLERLRIETTKDKLERLGIRGSI